MGALLAASTFILFITIDYLLYRQRQKRAEVAQAIVPSATPSVEPVPVEEPVWVAGYQLPDRLHYHPGHTWVRILSPDTVAIGLDDFARKLIGKVETLKLPRIGSWLRQGGEGFRVNTNGKAAELLSPVEGEVVEVNADLKKQPTLCATDPFGRGWLLKVRSANLAANLRNLLNGNLARRWTEDAHDQLELELMALSGSVLRDGGELSPDFAEHLKPEDWTRLTQKFLLTKAQ